MNPGIDLALITRILLLPCPTPPPPLHQRPAPVRCVRLPASQQACLPAAEASQRRRTPGRETLCVCRRRAGEVAAGHVHGIVLAHSERLLRARGSAFSPYPLWKFFIGGTIPSNLICNVGICVSLEKPADICDFSFCARVDEIDTGAGHLKKIVGEDDSWPRNRAILNKPCYFTGSLCCFWEMSLPQELRPSGSAPSLLRPFLPFSVHQNGGHNFN